MTEKEMNVAVQLCKQIYRSQRYSSEKRNHNQPMYTYEELLEWLYKQENFPILIKNYIENNFKSKFIPSIDRLENSKPYSFNNIQLLSWGEHVNLPSSNRSKRVIKHSLDKKEIKIYDSATAAAKELFLSASHITRACKYGKKAYKHNWSYFD